MKVGRNTPCPCGSGKKFKKCCLAAGASGTATARPSPRFRFEPGSYGGPGRRYVPSIICHEQVAPSQWRDHFCLVNPTQLFDGQDAASARAEADLNAAFAVKGAGGSDADVAMSLRDKAYVQVDDFVRAGD
jgi:hypothetical protein